MKTNELIEIITNPLKLIQEIINDNKQIEEISAEEYQSIIRGDYLRNCILIADSNEEKAIYIIEKNGEELGLKHFSPKRQLI